MLYLIRTGILTSCTGLSHIWDMGYPNSYHFASPNNTALNTESLRSTKRQDQSANKDTAQGSVDFVGFWIIVLDLEQIFPVFKTLKRQQLAM